MRGVLKGTEFEGDVYPYTNFVMFSCELIGVKAVRWDEIKLLGIMLNDDHQPLSQQAGCMIVDLRYGNQLVVTKNTRVKFGGVSDRVLGDVFAVTADDVHWWPIERSMIPFIVEPEVPFHEEEDE